LLRVADALFEAVEVMISGIKRMLHVSRFVISPLDITRFLAVQETDDELVNSLIPVRIGTISIIAKIGIKRLFPLLSIADTLILLVTRWLLDYG